MGTLPQPEEKQDYIRKVISLEEERFYATIDQGTSILEEYMKQVEKRLQYTYREMVFKLHDTFGFPLDLTREIASEGHCHR